VQFGSLSQLLGQSTGGINHTDPITAQVPKRWNTKSYPAWWT